MDSIGAHGVHLVFLKHLATTGTDTTVMQQAPGLKAVETFPECPTRCVLHVTARDGQIGEAKNVYLKSK